MPALAYSVSLKSIEAIFGGRKSFTPSSLFAASEPGGWYDPSDLTTLFQDAAGTTPVTAVEQPVGLVLDKSRGLVLGSELVTNGDFSSGTTGWTAAAGNVAATITVVDGRGRVTNTSSSEGRAYQTFTGLTVGRFYLLTCDAYVGTATVSLGWTSNSNTTGGEAVSAATSGPLTLRVQATAATMYLRIVANTAGSGRYADFDNVSVRELPGAHLSQSTAAARPVLSARVNLLERTEEFDNAYWLKESQNSGSIPTITANAGNSPLGTLTAERIQFSRTGTTSVDRSRVRKNSIATTANTDLKFSIWLKSYSGANQTIEIYMNFGAGALLTATVTNEWQQFSVAANTGAGTSADIIFGLGHGSSTATSSDVLAWGADLRPANAGVGLPSYQRVGAATAGSSTAAGNADYDTTGFPLYLKFDGTDDSLSSGSIDFTSTDKMSVFAGVRKLSDGSTGVVYELSAAAGGNNGSFHLYNSGGSANYTISSQGTSTASTSYTNAAIAAPITNVATSVLGISTDQCVLRLNGSQVAQSTTDQGTGNFGNYPLYVGRRGGTSLPFNGHIYSLIVRGAATDAATITATETWVNGKTKAF